MVVARSCTALEGTKISYMLLSKSTKRDGRKNYLGFEKKKKVILSFNYDYVELDTYERQEDLGMSNACSFVSSHFLSLSSLSISSAQTPDTKFFR